MEIRYVATPADIDVGLRHSKRVSALLWVHTAVLGLLALGTGYFIFHRLTVLMATTTLAYAMGVRFWFMPWMFRRKVKKDERVLSISDDGISTTVGSMRGQYSWAQIAEFYSDEKAIVIVR